MLRDLFASLGRTRAMVVKEFLQLQRERTTFAMMLAVPLLQLVLFGYAIDTNPRDLPTTVLARDHSPEARAVLAALEATGYFRIVGAARDDADVEYQVHSGRATFAVEIPAHFGRDVRRGERPAVLLVADASDPTAAVNALGALDGVERAALAHVRGVAASEDARTPFRFVVHRRYNPALESSLNIVPGLVGTILTLTLVIFTALAVTRETERGTMESLLALPIHPIEVMLGKIAPYVLVGALQFALILAAARLLFDVPLEGSLALLAALTLLFVLANLAVGYTFSTVARSQLQAMQMALMFFLPSMLLSGFLFPFLGMPRWARAIGEALPLTHYLRIVRGILLKGAEGASLAGPVAALAAITAVAMAVAALRFRRTLD